MVFTKQIKGQSILPDPLDFIKVNSVNNIQLSKNYTNN